MVKCRRSLRRHQQPLLTDGHCLRPAGFLRCSRSQLQPQPVPRVSLTFAPHAVSRRKQSRNDPGGQMEKIPLPFFRNQSHLRVAEFSQTHQGRRSACHIVIKYHAEDTRSYLQNPLLPAAPSQRNSLPPPPHSTPPTSRVSAYACTTAFPRTPGPVTARRGKPSSSGPRPAPPWLCRPPPHSSPPTSPTWPMTPTSRWIPSGSTAAPSPQSTSPLAPPIILQITNENADQSR